MHFPLRENCATFSTFPHVVEKGIQMYGIHTQAGVITPFFFNILALYDVRLLV